MATWRTASIVNIPSLRDALASVKSLSNTLRIGLDAAKVAVAAQAALIPGAINIADALTQIVVDQTLGAILDVFSFGAYMVPIYPVDVDLSRAILSEKLDEARLDVEMQTVLYKSAVRANDRTRAVQQKKRLDEATKRAESLRRRFYFTVPNQLATNFDYAAFVQAFKDSISDEWDTARPQFSRASLCAGVAVCAGADAITDFAAIVQSLGQWLGNADMLAEAAMLTSLTDVAAGRRSLGSSPSTPPDWMHATIAQAIGIEDVIRQLRQASGALGVSSLLGSSTIASALKWIDRANRALAFAVDGASRMIAVLDAIAALNAQCSACIIGPKEADVIVEGGTLAPRYVRGIAGFAEALENAKDAPTAKWIAGVVIMSGFPMGIDAELLDSAIVQNASVRAASDDALAMVTTLKGIFR